MIRRLLHLFGIGKSRAVAVEAASLSDRGLVRRDNQDNLLVGRESGVYCVADGMGGGEGGAKASEIVCAAVAAATATRAGMPGRIGQVADAIRDANSEIREFAKKAGYRQMATTVTSLILDPGGERSAVLGYVGDSRLYRLRDGTLEQLSHDHTIAGELGRRASLRDSADTGQARSGRLSHVLTRAVGIEPEVQVEWRKIDLAPGDFYLLCTDGVYDMVPGSGIRRAVSSGGKCEEIVAKLRDMIVARGAIDNFTMVLLRIKG